MKLNKYFMLGLAGLAFAACSNEDGLPGNGDDGSAKSLIISISGISSSAGTKAGASDMAPGWEADNTGQGATNVQSVTLFFTDGAGAVKHTYVINSSTNNDKMDDLKSTGIKFVGAAGVTAVYAVANKEISNLSSIANINQLNTTLTQQGISGTGKISAKTGVVYAGGTTNILPATPNDESDGLPAVDLETGNTATEQFDYNYKAEIKLVPIISRIQITSIKVQSSGISNTFPSSAIGNVTANSLQLKWSNFKPTLYGVYLNRFHDQFNDLLGTTGVSTQNAGTAVEAGGAEYLYNSAVDGHIANGQWLFGTANTNMANNAAYINYSSSDYSALKDWGTETSGQCTLDMGSNCIAFNIFVPFNITTGAASSIKNPTIHFQFDNEIGSGQNAYKTEFIHASDQSTNLTDEEKNVAQASTINFDYTMVTTDDYLFANVSKLYSESTTTTGTSSGTELVLAPGKIYNMEVLIKPVNMTADLSSSTLEDYNVVVKITVQDFTEENIYPGLDE